MKAAQRRNPPITTPIPRPTRCASTHAALNADGAFAHPDEIQSTEDEPGHQDLCEREQRLFLKAIRGEIDLEDHLEDAINSLRIVFAADESMRTGEVVKL